MLKMKCLVISVPVLLGAMLAGCAVPQPPGKGLTMYKTEPTTKRGYWLYLPEDYVANKGRRTDGKKWPLVMTFHGMKPWDNSKPQVREWQEEADRYGYVVCAPDLVVCDTLKPFPVKIGPDLDGDEKAILAIMDDVFRKTEADPSQVLSTSWSSGGFVAHYMVNRRPDRFSCLSTRQSNFEAAILDAKQFSKYRDMPIGLYHTANDFGVCKRDTLKGIAWYKRLGATHLESGTVQTFGHERTPEVAADFFARACGAAPKTPPEKLARIRINEVDREQLAMAAPQEGMPLPPVPRTKRSGIINYSDSSTPSRSNRPARHKSPSSTTLFDAQPSEASRPPVRREASTARANLPRNRKRAGSAVATAAGAQTPARSAQHKPVEKPTLRSYRRPVYTPPERTTARRTPRRTPKRRTAPSPGTVSVEVSSTIGIAPLLIDYAVRLPPQLERGADFLWTDNGMPIGNGPSGQKVLTHAGEHNINVLVITMNDQELRAGRKVTVLAPLKRKTAGGF